MSWSQEPEKNENGFVQASVVEEKEPGTSVQIIQADNALPPRYMGSATDKEDMLALGRQQVLRVRWPRDPFYTLAAC